MQSHGKQQYLTSPLFPVQSQHLYVCIEFLSEEKPRYIGFFIKISQFASQDEQGCRMLTLVESLAIECICTSTRELRTAVESLVQSSPWTHV